MKPLKAHRCIGVLLLLAATTAFGADCKGLKELAGRATKPVQQLIEVVSRDSNAQNKCGSLASVLHLVGNTPKQGGRKLEDERPFDAHEAQAELAQAHADPVLRRRLDEIRKDIPDGPQRLLYEAATFDEEGYYSARDLRIRQLQQQLQ